MQALRTVAGVAALVLAVAASSCGGTSAMRESMGPAPKGLEKYYAQRVHWTDCGGGFRCGGLTVPLDYTHPAAGDLTIRAIKQPARNQDERIGSLVLNPGGPGGSGISFARGEARLLGKPLQDRFDIVGFDPRGVGESAPVRCLSSQQLDQYLSTNSAPSSAQERGALEMVSREFANGCRAKAGTMLPYIGTPTAARDIDVLRAALGDRRLTYYGASYGTYLGAYYADEFPKNVRALVLDGAIDPKLSESQLNIEQAKGFETALSAFAADCITRPMCPLGTTSVDNALSQVSAVISRAGRTPLTSTLGDGRQVDSALTVLGIASALYLKLAWPTLRQALSQAITSGDGTTLLQLSDNLVERRPDGTYSNQTESNMAINCVDKPYPSSVAAFQKEADEAKRVAPRFGPFVAWGSLPCAYWPAKIAEQPRALTANGAAPILVVGTTRDPATPYQWAKNLAAQLRSGVLLSLDGDGHTAYLQGNPCIMSAVERYLITGHTPARGTFCK